MAVTAVAKATEAKLKRQYGVLPWYRTPEGDVRVILITTRETRRWSIPRGNPMKGRKPYEAAGIEAYEEAGVIGRAGKKSLGSYDYDKRVGTTTVAVRVKVFPFRVSKRVDVWPEREERSVTDFSVAQASAMLDDAGLAAIVRRFAPRRGSTPGRAPSGETSGAVAANGSKRSLVRPRKAKKGQKDGPKRRGRRKKSRDEAEVSQFEFAKLSPG